MSDVPTSATKRALLNGATYAAVRLGTRVMAGIYGKHYRTAREAGETFFIDDLPIAQALPETQTAAANPDVPPGPAPVAHPFVARITTQGRYPDPNPAIGFRTPPLSGRLIAGVGEDAPRRAPRTFFHGLDTPYGAFEAGYPVYTSTKALDRVASAIWKNRRAVGPVAPQRSPVDPGQLADDLKARAQALGAVASGATPVTEAAIYDHVEQEVLPHAFVVAHPMEREKLLATPSPDTLQGVMRGYHDVNDVVLDIARHLRSLGYRAEANANLGGCPKDVVIVPLAVEAGLGTLGRHGSLITRSHGSNVRLAAVLTNAPLAFDAPVDFGVEAMCADCTVCRSNCPPNAIFETKQTVRGVERWHVDMDRCLPYFLENEGCGICITVCPWAQEGPLTALLQESRQDVARHWPDPAPAPRLTLGPETGALVLPVGGAED